MTWSETSLTSTASPFRRLVLVATTGLTLPLLAACGGGGGNAGGFFDGTPYVGDIRPTNAGTRYADGRPLGPDGEPIEEPAPAATEAQAPAAAPATPVETAAVVGEDEGEGAAEPAAAAGQAAAPTAGSAGPYEAAVSGEPEPAGATADRIRIGEPPPDSGTPPPQQSAPAEPASAPEATAGQTGAEPGTGTTVGTGNVNNDGVGGYPNLADVPTAPDDLPTEEERLAAQQELLESREATGGATGVSESTETAEAPAPAGTQAAAPAASSASGGRHLPADAPPSALAALGGGSDPAPAADGGSASVTTAGAAVIYFGHGSAELPPAARLLLEGVAERQQATGQRVTVVGYASSRATGDDVDQQMNNLEIAAARADAVAAMLVELGVPEDAIETSASTDGGEDEELARRVEISLGA